ncbi:MAG: oligosaccharide flippase family protein [Acidimicrobiales bacterium]
MSDAPEPRPDDSGGSVPLGFKRSVLTNYGNVIALLVVALLTTPLLTHGLGPERYGIWAMVGSIIPYLEILELGFASTTIVMLARHMASGDSESAQAILNTSLFLLIVPGLVCFGLACGVAVVLPHVVTITPSQVGAARTLVILLGIDMAFSIPSDTFGGGLIALQRWDLLNATLVAVILGQALGWFIVIRLGGGLVALGLVTVGVSLVGQLARFVIFRRLLPDLKITPKSFDRRLVRSFAGLSGWFSVSQLVFLAVNTIDVVIVGAVVGVAEAGIYAVGLRLSTLASSAVTPVTGVFAPASAHSIGRGDADKLSSMVVMGNRVATSIAIPAALVTAVLARPALRAWVGPLYVEAAVVVVLLSAAVVVQSSAATSRSVLAGAAEPRLPTIFGVAGLMVHVVLAVVLGRRYGIEGVASAVLIASILFDGVAMMLLTSRRYGVRIPSYLALLLRAHLLPLICTGAVGLYLTLGPLWDFVQTHTRPVSVLAVIVSGLVMLAIYFAIYAFTGLSAQERESVIGRVRALRRRRT